MCPVGGNVIGKRSEPDRENLPTPGLKYAEDPDRSRNQSASSAYLRPGVGGHRTRVIFRMVAAFAIAGAWMIESRAANAPASAPTTLPTSMPASASPERLSVLAFNPVDAGRYLVKITGCNDCHTPGWEQTGGNIPEAMWLTGLPIGWRGPWGTTYASNLRLFVKPFTADTWVQVMRSRNLRPPMPWNSFHAMSDADLRAVYEYIRSLGPAGEPMPAFVPAGEEPKTPYFVLEPQTPAAMQMHAATAPVATGPTAKPVVQPTSAPASK